MFNVSDPDSNVTANPNPDWESVFGSRQAKIVPLKRKKLRKRVLVTVSVWLVIFLEPECPL
jgi:hypothetical protein